MNLIVNNVAKKYHKKLEIDISVLRNHKSLNMDTLVSVINLSTNIRIKE